MIFLFLITLLAFSVPFLAPANASAEWVSLISSTDFDGIKADVLTTGGGVLAVLLVILGIGILVRVMGR